MQKEIFTITIKDKYTEQELNRNYNLNGKTNDELGEILRDMLDIVQINEKRIPF